MISLRDEQGHVLQARQVSTGLRFRRPKAVRARGDHQSVLKHVTGTCGLQVLNRRRSTVLSPSVGVRVTIRSLSDLVQESSL